MLSALVSSVLVSSILVFDVFDKVDIKSAAESESVVLFVGSNAALTDPTVNDTVKKSSIITLSELNSCFPMYSPHSIPIELLGAIYNFFTISMGITLNCT